MDCVVGDNKLRGPAAPRLLRTGLGDRVLSWRYDGGWKKTGGLMAFAGLCGNCAFMACRGVVEALGNEDFWIDGELNGEALKSGREKFLAGVVAGRSGVLPPSGIFGMKSGGSGASSISAASRSLDWRDRADDRGESAWPRSTGGLPAGDKASRDSSGRDGTSWIFCGFGEGGKGAGSG